MPLISDLPPRSPEIATGRRRGDCLNRFRLERVFEMPVSVGVLGRDHVANASRLVGVHGWLLGGLRREMRSIELTVSTQEDETTFKN